MTNPAWINTMCLVNEFMLVVGLANGILIELDVNNFQIKHQRYCNINAIDEICHLDYKHTFISVSRDKKLQIWSLQPQNKANTIAWTSIEKELFQRQDRNCIVKQMIHEKEAVNCMVINSNGFIFIADLSNCISIYQN